MPSSFFKRHFLLFVLGGILVSIAIQGFLIAGENYLESQPAATQIPRSTPIPTPITPESTQPTTYFQRPDFEAGIVLPGWSQTSYGPADTIWQDGLNDISRKTGARWLEMSILFSQTSPDSTQVFAGRSTPTAASVLSGIRKARSMGYHVFLAPLLGVDVQGAWAASIQFYSVEQTQQWFDSFWQAFQPYAVAAQLGGAEQLSIGTEEVWLQQFAPTSLWNTLIARVRNVFTGTITYDINWTTLSDPLPRWLNNAELGMVGVSEYIPLIDTRSRVDPAKMFSLWRDKVKGPLDKFAKQLGKPILLSEIGYRNSADALYHPWFPDSTVSPPDPAEQAAACDAALANVIPDKYIAGIFFWGWDEVGGFKLSGQPATDVILKWYTSPQA
jgi:hypothetical protein